MTDKQLKVLALKKRVSVLRATLGLHEMAMKLSLSLYQKITGEIIRNEIKTSDLWRQLIRGEEGDPASLKRQVEELEAALIADKRVAEEVREIFEKAYGEYKQTRLALRLCEVEVNRLIEG